MFKQKCDLLDISICVNRSSFSNPSSYPSADGLDYVWLKPGVISYEQTNKDPLYFRVLSPNENNGMNLIVTQGGVVKRQTSVTFPTLVRIPVPAELSAGVLKAHFLGIAAMWADSSYEPEGTHGADIIFNYSDGSQFVQPLINGLHYADWIASKPVPQRENGDGSTLVTVLSGATSKKEQHSKIDLLSIDCSAHSQKKLKSILFHDLGTPAMFPLFAVTLEREIEENISGLLPSNIKLSDITSLVKLHDPERLLSVLDFFISDIERVARTNLIRAQSRALMLVTTLTQSFYEIYPNNHSLELTVINASRAIPETPNAKALVHVLKSFISEPLSLYKQTPKPRNREIETVIEYIRTHYAENLNAQVLAEMIEVSESHFRDLFRKSAGMSLGKYLMMVRLENAKRLLKTTRLTINEISHNIGFEDTSYFSKAFKKHNKISPLEFRR